MVAISLTTMRARVRVRADMATTLFVADSANEIDAFINEGVQMLHEKLVKAYGSDYSEKTVNFTTDANGEVLLSSVATDFFKLLGVDVANSAGGYTTVHPYKRAERNNLAVSASELWGATEARYKLSGGKLRILPAMVRTGRIWYSPCASLFDSATPSTTVEFYNGWERYVVVYAAIQCMMKEESDTAGLERLLEAMDRQLNEIIENRDAGEAMHAVDVEGTNAVWWP